MRNSCYLVQVNGGIKMLKMFLNMLWPEVEAITSPMLSPSMDNPVSSTISLQQVRFSPVIKIERVLEAQGRNGISSSDSLSR